MPQAARPYLASNLTMSQLVGAIGRFAQNDGDYNTAIPALKLHRRAAPTEPLHCIYNLGLGVVAQGDEQVLIGEQSIDYGPGQSMLTTIDLPARVACHASHRPRTVSRPHADAGCPLDSADRFRDGRTSVPTRRRATIDLVRSTGPDAARCPHPTREPSGRANLGSAARAAHPAGNYRPTADWSARPATSPPRDGRVPRAQIAKVVAWLKQNFVQPLQGDDLAQRAHMSPSTFRQHFRALRRA